MGSGDKGKIPRPVGVSHRPQVSAILIVRDEEWFLPDCLASLTGVVDEIVVVDTGSRDATKAIAVAAGAKTLDFPWIDDFAAARNAAIDAASGDWLLYIDADERLSGPQGLSLGETLADATAFAATVRFRPRLRATPYREHRLFRKDPRIRFVGAIHETIMPALHALVEEGAGRIVESRFAIQHLGYEGELSHKHRRNLPMLQTMVKRWPERLYYWCDLAQALKGTGRNDEAIAACRDGLEAARVLRLTRPDPVAALIAQTLAEFTRERGEDPLPLVAEGLAYYPEHWGLRFLEARALVDASRFDDALAILDLLLAVDVASYCDPHVSYDERLFGVDALELKAVALLRAGRRLEAGRAFAQASALAPETLSYRVRAQALLGAAGPNQS
ncbi:MAG: glycosyltransferase [Bradyrhizobium sp.]|nr:MAG: glycosyltransferase [Bradyrhizobium sp.]